MKYFISILFSMNVAFSFAQIIKEPQQVSLVKKTVEIRHLKPSKLNNQNIIEQKQKSANEEELEFIPEKKKKVEKTKIPFPAVTVSVESNELPLQNKLNPNTPAIYESPCVNYKGLNGGGTIPADVSGAVGFDEIFMALNDSFKIQNKNGDSLYQQAESDPNGFWSASGATNLFDPKIIYDPYRHRWIFVILKNGGSSGQPQNSTILLAVSQTPDPMGAWYQYIIDGDAENDEWFDYPSLGFNKNWLVITGNLFAIGAPGSSRVRTFAININDLYAGLNLGLTSFTTTGYSTICPALTYDPNMNDIWCVTNDDVDDNDLRFFKVSGTPSNPSLTEEGFISISPDWGRGGIDIGPQAGNSTRINTGDHRVLSVIWRNGILYSAQTIFLPDVQNPADNCTIQIVSCDPGTETVHEAIRIASSNTTMYAFPCLAVNNNSDLILSCSKFTFSTYPSAVVLVRRNGASFFQSTFKAGEDWYVNYDGSAPPRNRWGDYTTAMVDPSDDNSVWVAADYSRLKSAGNVGRYGTWWAKICSGVCAPTVNFSTILTNGDMRKYEASDSIDAFGLVPPGASIKLDAGTKIKMTTGFRALQGSRVRTFLEGCGGPQ